MGTSGAAGGFQPLPRNLTILWATRRAALCPWITLSYVEKVRPQFFSLRHPPERSGFCVNEQAENP
jgi:hypothetical protein